MEKKLKEVIEEADLIIFVLDGKDVNATKSKRVERYVLSKGKKILYVVNKSDLINERKGDYIYVSAKERLGTRILRNKIFSIAKKKKLIVGVVGFPNVGKSSLINALVGKKKAGYSKESGFTKGKMKVRLSKNVYLIDTPGVIFERNEKLAQIGVINPEKLKNAQLEALKVIEAHKSKIKNLFNISADDEEEVLEELGKKWNFLKKGGAVDLDRTAKNLLRIYQNNFK